VGVKVVGGAGSVVYVCDGPLTVDGGAAKITAGPVTIVDVEMYITFDDRTMQAFKARVSGIVDVSFMKGQGLDLPDGGSGASAGRCRLTVSKPVLKAPTVSARKLQHDEPVSNFAFNFNLRCYTSVETVGSMTFSRSAIEKFRVDEVKLNVKFSVATGGGEGKMSFSAVGSIALVYPCKAGDSATGEATLNALVPGRGGIENTHSTDVKFDEACFACIYEYSP
jgi:hypothetical protein